MGGEGVDGVEALGRGCISLRDEGKGEGERK